MPLDVRSQLITCALAYRLSLGPYHPIVYWVHISLWCRLLHRLLRRFFLWRLFWKRIHEEAVCVWCVLDWIRGTTVDAVVPL